jgi:ribosomal protein L20
MGKSCDKQVRDLSDEVLKLHRSNKKLSFEAAVGRILDSKGFCGSVNRTAMFKAIAKHCRSRRQAQMDRAKRKRTFNELQISLLA